MIKRKIKVKLKTKIKKRGNPEYDEESLLELEAKEYLEQFGKNIKIKYLAQGGYAETYYFTIKNSDLLKPGEYVLKIFLGTEDDFLNKEDLSYLIKLSKSGLIPKIYHIDNNHIVMKYVRGKTLKSLVNIKYTNRRKIITSKYLSYNELLVILDKIIKLTEKWHSLKFTHGDLHEDNMLITDSGKLYFIDPYTHDNLGTFKVNKLRNDLNSIEELNFAIKHHD